MLKLTGRNEGEPRKTLGEAIYAVFADCCEAGSAGDLEETDPVVLSALDGWLNFDGPARDGGRGVSLRSRACVAGMPANALGPP